MTLRQQLDLLAFGFASNWFRRETGADQAAADRWAYHHRDHFRGMAIDFMALRLAAAENGLPGSPRIDDLDTGWIR